MLRAVPKKKSSTTATAAEVLRIRQNAGLTQKEAAALVEVHEVTWQRWEAGTVKRLRRRLLVPVVAAAAAKKRVWYERGALLRVTRKRA